MSNSPLARSKHGGFNIEAFAGSKPLTEVNPIPVPQREADSAVERKSGDAIIQARIQAIEAVEQIVQPVVQDTRSEAPQRVWNDVSHLVTQRTLEEEARLDAYLAEREMRMRESKHNAQVVKIESNSRKLTTVKLRLLMKKPELPVDKAECEKIYSDIAVEMEGVGYKKAYMNHVVKYVTNCSPDQVEDWGDPYLANLKRLIAQQEEAKEKATAFDYWYVTMNPKPDVSYERAIAVFEQFLAKEMNAEHCYSMELHTLGGQRLHFHALIKKTDNQHHGPKKFYTATSRAFQDICSCTKSTLNLKRLKGERNYIGVYKYIHGEKEADKMEHVELDREWRRLNGYQDVYYGPEWTDKVAEDT